MLVNDDIIKMLVYKPNQKMLLASSLGKGFIVNFDELIAGTKLGKQVMQVPEGHTCIVCKPVNGDMVATIGENRKLLVFKLSKIPEIKKGQGVTLQKFKDGKLSDVTMFSSAKGLN